MQFLLACATLVGTIIGVGIFSLPAVVARSGWETALFVSLLVLAVVIVSHLAYAHVVTLTATRARLPGYADIWLGRSGKYTALLSQILGFIGSTTAYILLGGIFLSGLVSIFFPFPAWAGMVIFAGTGAALVWRGAKSIAEAELAMVLTMVLAIAILAVFGSSGWSRVHLTSLPAHGSPWLLYGVLMFALWGMSVIPQVAEVATRRYLGQALFAGILASFALTLLFVLLIIGTEGRGVSDDALTSLVEHRGTGMKIIGYGFGILATFTSHLTLTRTNMDMLRLDFRLSRAHSFAIAAGVPLVLLMAGVNDFVKVIAVTGAVSLGLEGALALLIEEHALQTNPRRKLIHIPPFLRIITLLMLAAGIVVELLATFGLL